MRAIDILLASFDDVLDHKWESTSSTFTDLTDEEASWQPPAYADVEPEEGLPLPGTILWQIAHLEYCTRHYTDVMRNRPVVEELPIAPPPDLSLNGLTAALRSAHADLRVEIARLGDDELDTPARGEMSVAEFLRMVMRHEAWHAGQMAMGRRLYRGMERG